MFGGIGLDERLDCREYTSLLLKTTEDRILGMAVTDVD